ncbi:hypothetical protein DPMN_113850 [Dreissena polymorpha]|uniref:Uncharacterized protein n=1 Tax=Dreissena polymorpha TaxID=45954 RepID=A0A9D4KJF5_DREPO|nr:hypothetical protein DPMN_113850 [Dreissena polymorpha]
MPRQKKGSRYIWHVKYHLQRAESPIQPSKHAATAQTVKHSNLAYSKRASSQPDRRRPGASMIGISKVSTITVPGADIDSNHVLVIITFKLKLKNKLIAKYFRIKFNLERS